MKKLLILTITLCLLSATWLHAQTAPYSWTFTAKKIAADRFEVHCTVEVNPPWHTYSQTTPEGGPVPTKFVFTKNPLCMLDSAVAEEGKMVTKHESVFGVDVKYFEGSVDFVQRVKRKGNAKTNFSGAVTFMVCDDMECLPPVIKNFTVALF